MRRDLCSGTRAESETLAAINERLTSTERFRLNNRYLLCFWAILLVKHAEFLACLASDECQSKAGAAQLHDRNRGDRRRSVGIQCPESAQRLSHKLQRGFLRYADRGALFAPTREWLRRKRAAPERGLLEPAARPAGQQAPRCQLLAGVGPRLSRAHSISHL